MEPGVRELEEEVREEGPAKGPEARLDRGIRSGAGRVSPRSMSTARLHRWIRATGVVPLAGRKYDRPRGDEKVWGRFQVSLGSEKGERRADMRTRLFDGLAPSSARTESEHRVLVEGQKEPRGFLEIALGLPGRRVPRPSSSPRKAGFGPRSLCGSCASYGPSDLSRLDSVQGGGDARVKGRGE